MTVAAALLFAACGGGQRFGTSESTETGPTQRPDSASVAPDTVTPDTVVDPSSDDSATASDTTTTFDTGTADTTATPDTGSDDATLTNTADSSTIPGDDSQDTPPSSVPDSGTETSETTEPDAPSSGDECSAPGVCPPETLPDAGTEPTATNDSNDTDDTGTAIDDECPDHATQVLKGPCGCGFPADVSCEIFKSHLIHRYSFDAAGVDVIDSIGGANGRAIDTTLDGSGSLELSGAGEYVELPSGLFSQLTSATFEVWLRWDGGQTNQRVFNFGTRGDDGRTTPPSYLSLSPNSGNDANLTVQLRTNNDRRRDFIETNDALTRDQMQHVVVVITENRVELYVSGQRVAESSTSQRLNELRDNVNWLGRALYADYPPFDGALYEFRVYDAPLSAEQVAINTLLGEDAVLPRLE